MCMTSVDLGVMYWLRAIFCKHLITIILIIKIYHGNPYYLLFGIGVTGCL